MMNAAEITAQLPVVYQLTGRTLEGGWLVGEVLSSPIDGDDTYSTGGTFSICYKCSKDGKEAFLKVFDVFRAMQSDDQLAEMAKINIAYDHEDFLLKLCEKAGLTRVVRGLASVKSKLQEPMMGNIHLPFCYVIFEVADQGDLRQMLHRLGDVNLAVKFKILHEVAIGLQQLHSTQIAHQDLKPSNVGIFKKEADGAKVLDLGRATSNDHKGIYDHMICPGDGGYAPPEQMYGYDAVNFNERRAGADLFQLGSLLSFLLFWQHASEQIISRIPTEFGPQAWAGPYEDVLPYLNEGFAEWLDSVEREVPEWCRKDVLEILRTACNPDPHLRGDPKARMQTRSKFGPQIGIDRYVTKFSRLTKLAELHVRLSGVATK